jgi:hypothetical protein
MIKRGDKNAQGLSTNAIILIILGVVVLVVLIIGFYMGWGNLKDRLSSSNNVDTIAQACATACSTNSKYDFCSAQRELKTETEKVTTNCATFSVISSYSKYGIAKCPAISCDFDCDTIILKDSQGNDVKSAEFGGCIDTQDDITSIVKIKTAGQKCCIRKF